MDHDRVTDWVKRLEPQDTPLYNFFQRMEYRMPMPPVIGHTPEQRGRRFVWSRLSRIGHALHCRLARFEHHERDPYGDGPEEYWLKKDWRWLEAVGRKSVAAMSKPIYDPDWVPPKPKPVPWGQASVPERDPDIIGVVENESTGEVHYVRRDEPIG